MSITRAEILSRSLDGWPAGEVPYDMSQVWNDDDGRTDEDGWRRDCSGYVAMCWTAPRWTNTVTLISGGFMVEIPADQLEPGDAIGRCGEGTSGAAGHIMLWVGREPNGRHRIREQAGGLSGWRERAINWPEGYRAFRYTEISEATSPIEEDEDMAAKGIIVEVPGGGVLAWVDPQLGKVWQDIQDWATKDVWRAAGWATQPNGEPFRVDDANKLGREVGAARQEFLREQAEAFAKALPSGAVAAVPAQMASPMGAITPTAPGTA